MQESPIQQSPKLYIDNFGKIYRNATFKRTSLYIHFLSESISRRKSLLSSLQQCTNHTCLTLYTNKLQNQQAKYDQFQNSLMEIVKKTQHEVLLCGDLYVHNDILFCQNQAREGLWRKMKGEYQKYVM